jgi:Serine dehydrogenase proteinase
MAKSKATRRVRIKKPPILFSRTQRLLTAIESEIGCPLLTYWTSPTGAVCDNDVLALYEVLNVVGSHSQVALCIKSDGGSGEAALRLTHLLRQYADRVVALIPLECASAATMLALGADELRMGPLAHLSAVDTSLRHELSPVDVDNEQVSVSQDELLRVVRLWNQSVKPLIQGQTQPAEVNPYQALFSYVHPLVIGAVDRISSLSNKLCREILSFHMTDAEKVGELSSILSEGYPSHSYPITLREAQRIGLNALKMEQGLNDKLLELNSLYAEMGQKAVTDYNESSYHSHEIVNIVEGRGIQVHYQTDKDWHYRKEERRWAPMNDQSSWQRVQKAGRGVQTTVLHIR